MLSVPSLKGLCVSMPLSRFGISGSWIQYDSLVRGHGWRKEEIYSCKGCRELAFFIKEVAGPRQMVEYMKETVAEQ